MSAKPTMSRAERSLKADLDAANEEVRDVMNQLADIRGHHERDLLAMESKWAARCGRLLMLLQYQAKVAVELADRVASGKP